MCTQAPWACAISMAAVEVVERTGVQVSRLQAEDRRPVAEPFGQRVDADPALLVGGHHARRSQAQIAQRHVDRVVPLGADQHGDRRRTDQAVLVEVPAGVGEHLLAAGGQSR